VAFAIRFRDETKGQSRSVVYLSRPLHFSERSGVLMKGAGGSR
jgi:hypothetical protein